MNALQHGSTDWRLIVVLLLFVMLDLGMQVYSIIDLYRPARRVKGGNKLVWLLTILLISTFGWLAYLLAGHEE